LNWSCWNLTYLENNEKTKKGGFTKLDVPTCKLGRGYKNSHSNLIDIGNFVGS